MPLLSDKEWKCGACRLAQLNGESASGARLVKRTVAGPVLLSVGCGLLGPC